MQVRFPRSSQGSQDVMRYIVSSMEKRISRNRIIIKPLDGDYEQYPPLDRQLPWVTVNDEVNGCSGLKMSSRDANRKGYHDSQLIVVF
uniref:Uncharacterized protein n=1 Tax=Anopheles atroparvus TaxID=41427 RepID=A0AAG5DUC5_ANOAO